MNFRFLPLMLMLLSCSAPAQETFCIMSYNAENLFDTSDDPDKEDEEFTPQGAKHWNKKRYWNKMGNLSRVIVAVDEADTPELVALCEVENDSVLKDLTLKSPLRNVGYSYVITDSPDARGIDVALLYKRGDFRLLQTESLRVDLKGTGKGPTRDILHVTGRVVTGDTLDVYVCHWPSRVGGVEESEPYRQRAAATAMESIRGVIAERRKPYIVLMGDLNEGPSDPSVREGLGALPFAEGASASDTCLVTLMDAVEGGSYRYEGAWDMYDQFVVSATFLNGTGCISATDPRIGSYDFLLEEDKKYGGVKPFRTYNGYKYQNGFSDHLPIAFTLEF